MKPALLFALALWLGAVSPAAATADAARPNIIFILADDLGYGDLGCYGQKRIQTPNLDRMAAQGMRFTQVYAGATVCAPSRCSLMTGLHQGHSRVRGNAAGLAQCLRPEDVTVAEVLKSAGYTTGLVGKWGLGDVGGLEVGLPGRQGFDYFFGYLSQVHAHNYYPSFLWRNESRVPLRNIVPDERASGAGVSTNKLDYSPDLLAAEALAFIRRERDHPFFLCFTPTLPHANNEAGKLGMEVPDLGAYRSLDWPEPQKAHAAMISRLDRDVGRVFALLKELGLDDRTIVFFSSDNGPHKEGGFDPSFNDSNGPLRGIKRDLYEGGIRVPMIVRWPGHVPAGRVSDQVWAFWDFLPTAAALAGAQPPANLDGLSLLPTLTGRRQREEHAYLYWEFHEGGFKQAIRAGDWKGVRLAPGEPLELYRMRPGHPADLAETNNVAAGNPKIVRRLEALLQGARTESPDWPMPAPKPPGTVIWHSPATNGIYIGSPGLARLPEGAYLAKGDEFGPGSTEKRSAVSRVFRSDDRGARWREIAKLDGLFWASLFEHRGAAYLLGTDRANGRLVIRRSADGGTNWTAALDAKSGLLREDAAYHCAPVPVIRHHGRLWRACEDVKGPAGWGSHFRAFMMSVPEDADLLDASNWTFSNAIGRDPAWLGGKFGGWLEGNAVVAPDGGIVNILRADYRSLPEKAAVIQVSPDGREARFDPGTGFVDFPGGCKKFSIRFDPVSRRYWTLANWVPARHGSFNVERARNTLALVSSPDLQRWKVHTVLLHDPDPTRHAFQYVDWLFEGGDLIAVSRTAFDDDCGGAHSGHDANFLTFHRFKNFRTLTAADAPFAVRDQVQ